jgi:hypothetical protein
MHFPMDEVSSVNVDVTSNAPIRLMEKSKYEILWGKRTIPVYEIQTDKNH